MSLANYVLNGPSTVIADDDRDPHVSWEHHIERTEDPTRGGVDLVAVVGTPVLAPTAGTMAHVPNDGSAGNSCRFYHDDNPGWKDVFSHLSSYAAKSGQHFEQGDVIAYSGNTGGVTQHLHRHLLDPSNVRRNPWDYFTNASTAGGTGAPITNYETENDMLHYVAVTENQIIGKGQRFVQGADGPLRVLGVGEWSVVEHNFPQVKPAEWSAEQLSELIERVGLYEYATDGPSGIARLTGRILYTPTERTYPVTSTP